MTKVCLNCYETEVNEFETCSSCGYNSLVDIVELIDYANAYLMEREQRELLEYDD